MGDIIGWAWATSRALETMDGSDDPCYAMCNGLFKTRELAEKDAEINANGGRTEGATDDHLEDEPPYQKLTWQAAHWPEGATTAEFDHEPTGGYDHEVFLVYPVRFL